MIQNIANFSSKYKVGNIIKYCGDTYKIIGIDHCGYNVHAIDFIEEEETKTGVGFSEEEKILFLYDTIEEYKNHKNKKMYHVFSVDICFTPYSMEYKLIGAENKDDLISHLNDIFGDEIDKNDFVSLIFDDYRIKEISGLYTDIPYKILDTYAYYE